MTATLEWDGIPVYIIGMGRGISAIIGISATFLYPSMETRISTLRTGLWSIWSQVYLRLKFIKDFERLEAKVMSFFCMYI